MPRPQTPLFRNPTRALARAVLDEAIRHPSARQWDLQNLGVLRTFLPGDAVLHVWCPELAVPGVTAIHTHPWRFSSFVVAGIVENIRYTVNRDAAARGPSDVGDNWRLFRELRVKPERAEVDAPCLLRLLGVERIRSGSWYFQEASDVHESRPMPGTVTLIQRERTSDGAAHAYFPEGSSWVSGGRRPATEPEVVKACTLAVERWLS